MPRVSLNFAKHNSRAAHTRLLSWTLCAGLLVLCAWQLTERERLITQISETDTQLSRLERHLRLTQRTVTIAVTDPQAAQETHAIAKQLTLPWIDILSSLRELRNNDIHLSKIEPKANSNEVQIQGYATQQHTLFAFIAQLEKTGDWQEVLPQRQEQSTHIAGKPLYFQLTAQWRGQP